MHAGCRQDSSWTRRRPNTSCVALLPSTIRDQLVSPSSDLTRHNLVLTRTFPASPLRQQKRWLQGYKEQARALEPSCGCRTDPSSKFKYA
jgi:hypothetical protein